MQFVCIWTETVLLLKMLANEEYNELLVPLIAVVKAFYSSAVLVPLNYVVIKEGSMVTLTLLINEIPVSSLNPYA